MVMHVLGFEIQLHHAYFPFLKLDAHAMDFYAVCIFGKMRLYNKNFMLNT